MQDQTGDTTARLTAIYGTLRRFCDNYLPPQQIGKLSLIASKRQLARFVGVGQVMLDVADINPNKIGQVLLGKTSFNSELLNVLACRCWTTGNRACLS